MNSLIQLLFAKWMVYSVLLLAEGTEQNKPNIIMIVADDLVN